MWASIWGLIAQVATYMGSLGSNMSGAAWATAIIGLILTLWKSSVLAPLWAGLPPALQAWMGPILGIIAALGSMLAGGGTLSWSVVLAGLSTGALGVAVHVLLESLKVIPGISSVYVTIINFVESFLAAPPETKSVKGEMRILGRKAA